MAYYVGVMSGTSLDGVDIAIVDFDNLDNCRLIGAKTFAFPEAIHQQLHTIINHPECHLRDLGQLDTALGQFIGQIIQQFLAEQQITADQVSAIGSHGHTLFHSPGGATPFSLQIGNASVIAELTGITTIADFRQRDIAAGGQGAPLVPAFHAELFSDPHQPRVIVNIGGIANITLLDKAQAILGFDTGPGNSLLDAWVSLHQQQAYDDKGCWAAKGTCQRDLLAQMLADPYFLEPIPKSTGREYFNLSWLEKQLHKTSKTLSAVDVQATLVELTAYTISQGIHHYGDSCKAVYICGGGIHNLTLIQRLQQLLKGKTVMSTELLGLHPDWVEATAFAWLAYRTLNGQAGNLPSVTGAKQPIILGAIHPV